eukprot:Skav231112  [mRNA]  locus=scaffold2605:32594:32869:+ [translate_table: standard]
MSAPEPAEGGEEKPPPEEKSSTRACAETTLDAVAVVGRGLLATGSAVLTVVQYTAYPIKEGVLCVMDTTGEYFNPYLKKKAATNVPTFRYG